MKKYRARQAAAAAALAVLALGASGCGAINDQATTMHYDASDGIGIWGTEVQVRNLMLVTNGADKPARFIGQVSNESANDSTLSIKAGAKTIELPVKAKSSINLQDEQFAEQFTIPGSGADAGLDKTTNPGLNFKVSITTGSDAAKSVNVPVVDGTLKEYAQYVPGGFDESNAEHLKPSEAAESH
ncbi:hypothetical protein [Galactobacter valiniphilus]|uniref:hypothetical protein n=1 Tax=Galactobacter valiniphilus TaxID=2676122 RepID=UPI003736FAB1